MNHLLEQVNAIENRTSDRDVFELCAIVRQLIGRVGTIEAWPQITEEGGLVSKRELHQTISDFAATYLPERV